MALKSVPMLLLTPILHSQFSLELSNDWLRLLTAYGIFMILDLGLLVNTTREVAFSTSREMKDTVFLASRELYLTLIIAMFLFFTLVTIFKNSLISLGYFIAGGSVMLSFFNNSNLALLLGDDNWIKGQRLQAFSILITSSLSLIGIFLFGKGEWAYLFFLHPLVLTFLFPKRIMTKVSKNEVNGIRRKLFHDSWKTGVGIILSSGSLQIAALIISENISIKDSVGLLFMIQIFKFIGTYSSTPLYVKIPQLSDLWSAKNIVQFRRIYLRNTYLSMAIFVALISIFIFAKLIVPISLFETIPSNIVVIFLSTGFFFERLYNLVLQAYTSMGNVVWHKTNLIYCLVLVTCLSFSVFFESVYFILNASLLLASLSSLACLYSLMDKRQRHLLWVH